ncbi:trophoblast glycoprotein [Lingula anatina]|uniref:Trophoblast glycoprotein n=1 Tax=Lingula anatina TaxID=7574 RepID=A0A1S3J6J4_LINAN|nr:trophoblast glycoprotein [Lingula anatina]|eukprot:XP_013405464.1 trophoblast glycoprotein [Lingula anatina]
MEVLHHSSVFTVAAFTVLCLSGWGISALPNLTCPKDLPQGCSCNDTTATFTCRNTKFQNADVLKQVPLNARTVVFTGNNIQELPINVVGNCSHDSTLQHKNLTSLDLSNNSIRVIPGQSFHCIPNLRILTLNENNWMLDNHTRVFSNLGSLETLNLRNALQDNPSTQYMTFMRFILTDSNIIQLKYLDLSKNEIEIFPINAQDMLCKIPNLQWLDLSNNKIGSIGTMNLNVTCSSKLKHLNLTQNNISVLKSEFLTALKKLQLTNVYLGNNPFLCDCDLQDFYNWLKVSNSSHFVIDKQTLQCELPIQLADHKILDLTQGELVCSEDFPQKSLPGSYVALSVVCGILGVLTLAVIYMNRHKVQACMKRMTKPFRLTEDTHIGYAAVQTSQTGQV